MEHSEQLLALWVGPKAQECAHHFYHLQAEQFFDEEEDPTNHQALWSQHRPQHPKIPRTVIFDTQSEHLTKIRKVNHKKILKQMSKPAANDIYFPFQFMPSQQEQKEEEQQDTSKDYLYDNWQAGEDNYCLIDKDYNTPTASYELWQSIYKQRCDHYEDKVRKHLEKCDFLRTLFVGSDASRLGFSCRLVQYLQDECPKRPQIFSSFSDPQDPQYYSECFIPLLGHIANQVTVLVDLSAPPSFEYFQGNSFSISMAPLLNSLLTPFMLKQSKCDEYIQKIQLHPKRSLFNLTYTLPVIDQDLGLHNLTDITLYRPRLLTSKAGKKKDEEEDENRVSSSNTTFLNLEEEPKLKRNKQKQQKVYVSRDKILSESYVFKGHFKEVSERFKDKQNHFEIRYLRGILLADPKSHLKYSPFYVPHYGPQVEAFPFHSVLRQHSSFGVTIRNYLGQKGASSSNELIQEWREGVLDQADLFSEFQGDESD